MSQSLWCEYIGKTLSLSTYVLKCVLLARKSLYLCVEVRALGQEVADFGVPELECVLGRGGVE